MTQLSWQPTKQQLEDAALAGGVALSQTSGAPSLGVFYKLVQEGEDPIRWQPHMPTTQGKSDLLDLMLSINPTLRISNTHVSIVTWLPEFLEIEITNNDKHAALARAVLEVAAQVGGVMRNNTMRGEVC